MRRGLDHGGLQMLHGGDHLSQLPAGRGFLNFDPTLLNAYMHMSAAGDPRLRGRGRHPGNRVLPDRAGLRAHNDMDEWPDTDEWW